MSPENRDAGPDVSRFPFDTYAGVNLPQLYPQMPTSDIRATLSGAQGAPLNHQFQPEIPSPSINMGMMVAHNQQLQLGFTQPYLDPAMASTINWLSNDLLLDTTGDRPTGNRPPPQSSQGGTIDSSLGQASWLPPVISAEKTSPSLPEHVYQTPSGNTSLGTDVDSPRLFSRDAAQSSTPQSRPCNASQRSADSYIDGGGARLPKYRRKQDPGLRPTGLIDIRSQLRRAGDQSKFSFPTIQGLREETSSEEVAFNFQLEPATYDNIYQVFIQLCCTENFLYPKFENKDFPPREALSKFVELYFGSFQTVYPILHGPTFNPNTCHWLLTMAVSAIGSYAAGIDEQDNCSAAFHEFLRRAIRIELLDCMLAYHFESRLLLSLDDGQAPLPSDENLWRASSVDAWKRLYDKTTGHEEVSLYNAVLTLYIEKKLVANIGEFGHILLVHALYRRMWEVGDYFRRPLSFWNPTAKKQPREAAIPSGSVWLPGIPSYSRWRNSACDCLDILHWAANSTIAKASGLEHPTVLYLHEARIILLVPFHEIRTLVTSIATEKVRWSARQQTIEWHYILRWIKHDQYKARLAVIHAGASLWHVRRYSTDAFHEPVAVFLAIITLWAYGMCHSQVFPDMRPRGGTDENLPSEPTFFHIDRPCDDELVQIFVRGGQGMKGNVTGVGDICAPEGPKRILQVGCETLTGLNSWGISKRFIAILTRLGDLMSCDK
ncbi:hypothetical protein BDV37DRAFT_268752 [Aspergillus pseudonomiae]|uniref:Transcription factor domain-containing protein n=1 Tax=Aspergillus pseudonomiae TaxID=1506151 RepID=A0A5N7DNE9_9EURO|nr:uncharacterized protein BDV37DRAFT_268752 [Aspergillus pseudonomiae]KAE8407997.1 hypothetical protein BDV37DRAFT_268752 [Aspergillus pseudonomiae]